MKSVLLPALALLPSVALAQTADRLDGLHVGAELARTRHKAEANVAGVPLSGHDSSLSYGGFLRYDEYFQGFYFGGQVDAEAGGKNFVLANGAGTSSTVDPKWSWSLSLRSGVAPVSNLLVYGRFGYASAKYDALFAGPALGATAPTSVTESGLQYGGGIEAALTPAVSLRAEYRQRDFAPTFKTRQFLVGASVKLWECC